MTPSSTTGGHLPSGFLRPASCVNSHLPARACARLRPRAAPRALRGDPNGAPSVDWFEVLTENYLVPGGRATPQPHADPRALSRRDARRLALDRQHRGPRREYLRAVRDLARRVEPAWISDHLCWTGVDGRNLHDLMPLPYTEEALRHVIARVREVQDFLGRRLRHRERVELRHLHELDAQRVGIPRRTRRKPPTVCCCSTSTMST